ncbi:NAD-binding protein, partial [Thermodesulfobacteriota bacterium]
ISVFLALIKSPVSFQEKLYLALIGPRGIIALAIASYAAFLVKEQEAGMATILNLTFAIIFLSGAIATIISRPMARLLKVMVRDSGLGIIFVGMNSLSTAIADFASRYVAVAFADTSRDKCSLFETRGYETVCADVLDSNLYEEARATGFGRLLVLTKDDALNQLITQAAVVHLSPEKVFRIKALSTEDAVITEATSSTQVAFSNEFFVEKAGEMLEKGEARLEVLKSMEAIGRDVVPLLELIDEGQGIRIVRAGNIVKNDTLCFVREKGNSQTREVAG